MKNGKEYIDSLRTRNIKVYYKGELLDPKTMPENPFLRGHFNSAALTYELAFDPAAEDLVTATSHLTGKKINRFTHIHHSTEDLVKKVKMLRMISLKTGSCYQRCVGCDAMNSVYNCTFEMDAKNGSTYHERFKNFLLQVQENDWMVAGAMTDVKGDRSLRPSQQADPDLHVHIVERRPDGVVLRGAKAHMTGMANSHWMLIMPTTTMREDDKDYAICCAIPVDAPGLIHIFGRQTNDDRKNEGSLDQGNPKYAIVGGETTTILEDVFVPNEYIFLNGETDYTGLLVTRFAAFHRQNYGACKGGVSDIVTGAAATAADMGGYGQVEHIKDKLAEMIHLTESMYACSVACSYEGKKLASGAYFVDELLANVGKHSATRFIYEINRLAQDIGGGIQATMPSEADLNSPEIGKYVEKYMKGVASVPTIERMKVLRLLENMTGGVATVESMHGAGAPQTQRVAYARLSNLEMKKKAACEILDVTYRAPEKKKK